MREWELVTSCSQVGIHSSNRTTHSNLACQVLLIELHPIHMLLIDHDEWSSRYELNILHIILVNYRLKYLPLILTKITQISFYLYLTYPCSVHQYHTYSLSSGSFVYSPIASDRLSLLGCESTTENTKALKHDITPSPHPNCHEYCYCFDLILQFPFPNH